MKHPPPRWAMKRATADDFDAVRQAHKQGYLEVKWPPTKELRAWAKAKGWPSPLFGFQGAFIKALLDTEQHFGLALNADSIELTIPQKFHTITEEQIQEWDALYSEVSENRQARWGELVAKLREIRRAVEVGVRVSVPGRATPLRSFQGFYDWAHGRYHMLEDGYDSWIGDDDS